MNRRAALLPVVAGLVMACGQAPASPSPSIPTAPMAGPGWTSLGSVGSIRGDGFVGLRVQTSGRVLALNVICIGTGSLVASYAAGEATPASPGGGLDAMVFPCTTGDGATARRELPVRLGPGPVTVSGGIVPDMGSTGPSSFAISVEETAP